VQEMQATFGKDLLIIWDNHKHPDCPVFQNVTCVSNIPVTATKSYTVAALTGLGHEKSIMWAVNHTDEYDDFWFMEGDVHYTDISLLKSVVYSKNTSDLIVQEPVQHLHHSVCEGRAMFIPHS
jgi:hypothetical protein